MNNKLSTCLAFIFGAAAGSFVTWRYLKDKYEQIAQEEIDSVKEVFLKREAAFESNEKVSEIVTHKVPDKPPLADYVGRLQKEGYINHSDVEPEKEEQKVVSDMPYVISPDEFGEFDEYEKVSLSYYADKILADENDEIVEDVEDTVGFDSLSHFGEYEDDSVFVRNDARKCDYEILLDQRNYSDVIKKSPHRMEE